MNKEKLEKHIKNYLNKIKTNNIEVDDLNEREERKKYYSSFNKQKVINMNEDEFYEYISKLWAMIIWGNKHYIINKYIEDNGFENLKKNIAELLYGDSLLEERWDVFKKRIKGFGPAMMSELLCYIYPDKYMIWNSTSMKAYSYLEINDVPVHNYQLTGKKYVEMSNISIEIKDSIKNIDKKEHDLLFVDYFFWDELRKMEVTNKKEIAEEKYPEEDNKSLHTELKEKVRDIGIWLGFDAKNEVKIEKGATVDCVWNFSINNVGKVTYVFEVQTKGSIDSLIMNLYKASNYKNVQGIIAVSDDKQLEKIKDEAQAIFKNNNLKIQLWNQDEVIDVWEKLQSVNENVNKILRIDDSLEN